MKYIFLTVLTFFAFLTVHSQKEKMLYKDASLTIEERVEDLLPRMSLEEKVAQMRIFHANIGVEANEQGRLKLSGKVIEKLKIGIAGIKNPRGTSIAPSSGKT